MEPSHEQAGLRRALGRRLVQVRGRQTQETYAAQLGIHVNTLARYERGERWPGADLLRLLADDGVDLHWLLTGERGGGAPQQEVYRGDDDGSCVAERHGDYRLSYDQSDLADFPGEVQRHTLSEGRGCSLISRQGPLALAAVDSQAELQHKPAAVYFDETWLRTRWGLKYEDVCLVQVQGDSMEPTLKAGDQVLVDRRDGSVPQDGLYLLRLGRSLIVRRLQRLPQGRCRVLSANPAYASFAIDIRTRKRECHVLGRVLWVGQSV